MNSAFVNQLLDEEETATLDFKSCQYPFEGADDIAKSELLKDILAFANAWRRTDAYILIGVEEVKGGRSRPIGVANHIDDAKLQQFVNSKTNRPISFSYQTTTIDSVQIAIIRIDVQERPFYLKKDYGKLKAGIVYLRRGSSTDTADAGEIHRMGLASAREERILEKPRLEPKLESVSYVNVTRHLNEWLFVELKLNFVIVNTGPVASHHWAVVVEEIDGHDSSRLEDYKFSKAAFPAGASKSDHIRIPGSILPGLPHATDLPFGVYLRPAKWDADHIKSEFELMLPPSLSLGFKAVSEASPGHKITSLVGPVFDRNDTLRRILERV